MSKVKTGIRYWLQLFLVPIYLLSFLFPRNQKIWVMGSTFGRRFADNPRYFYLYMNKANEDIKAVWISKNKELIKWMNCKMPDYPAFYLYSIKGIYYCLRAGVYYYDNYSKDICFILSGGAKKINLWHGIPLKKIQMDNRFDKVRHPANHKEKLKWMLRRMSDEHPRDFIVTSSQYLRPIFSSAFGTNRVMISGYPRNDRKLLESITVFLPEEEETIKRMKEKKKQGKKILLYMPTFRESEKLFFDVMDMVKFEKFLKKQNFYLCIKLHPKSKLKAEFDHIISDVIYTIQPDADPYAFLSDADVLITDYSSIYFDFLLYDRPIVYFSYDLEEYLHNSREFYFNYEEYTPGRHAYTMCELEEALCATENESEGTKRKEERNRLRELVFEYEDNYCRRLYEAVTSKKNGERYE